MSADNSNHYQVSTRSPAPTTPSSISNVGAVLSRCGFFADATTEAKAVAKVLAGREIGIGPISAMSHITIEKGKASYDAALLSYLLERSVEYDYQVLELSDTKCHIRFYRGGKVDAGGKPRGETCWTIERAKAAGLLNTRGGRASPWLSYPDDFLFARALSQGIRRYCPGLLIGSYCTGELEEPRLEAIQSPAASMPVTHIGGPDREAPREVQALPVPVTTIATAPPPPLADHLVRLKAARDELAIPSQTWLAILNKRKPGATSARELTVEQCEELTKALLHKIGIRQLQQGFDANLPATGVPGAAEAVAAGTAAAKSGSTQAAGYVPPVNPGNRLLGADGKPVPSAADRKPVAVGSA
jgi:hypothetical protein